MKYLLFGKSRKESDDHYRHHMRGGMRRFKSPLWMALGFVAANSIAAVTNEVPSAPFAGVGDVRSATWTITPVTNSSELLIRIDCTGFSADQEDGGYSLHMPGQVSAAMPGAPDIPRIARLVTGLDGYRPVLRLEGKQPTNISDVAVVAVKGYAGDSFVRAGPRTPDSAIYATGQFWPAELCRLEEACIGTQNVVRLECYPVQYNASTKVIRFYRCLEGVLRFEREP